MARTIRITREVIDTRGQYPRWRKASLVKLTAHRLHPTKGWKKMGPSIRKAQTLPYGAYQRDYPGRVTYHVAR